MQGLNEKEKRQEVRRLLQRWGGITAFCARRHQACSEFADLITSATDIHAPQLTGMPRSGKISKPTETAADQIMRLQKVYEGRVKQIRKEIEAEMRFASRIEAAIEKLKSSERDIIELRYRQGITFEQIAERVGYTLRRVQQIETSAIDNLRKSLSNGA